MVYGYIVWWYGAGYLRSWQIALASLYRTSDTFSLETLVKTWVAPWKNDVVVAGNIALSDQFKIWQQNFASRFVGFMIRTIMILAALAIMAVTTIFFALALAIWFLVPMLVILLPALGVILLFR